MNEQPYKTVDKFDKALGTLQDLPDVTHTKESAVMSSEPLIGGAQSFWIQMYRQIDRDGDKSKSKDTLFLQYLDSDRSLRIVIPHKAIQAIIRQYEALGTKNRRKAAKQEATRRKAAGIVPGFMKGKKGKGKK